MIYLNGEWMPIERAKIPVLDRGFIFGDGVYEVIPSYSGHPFRLREHLARLQSSLDGVRMDNPYSIERWVQLVREIIAKNPWEDQGVYLQVTRGVAPRNHPFPADVAPASTALWRSRQFASSETDLMSQRSQRLSTTDTAATPRSRNSCAGVVSGLDIMNTVGFTPFGKA